MNLRATGYFSVFSRLVFTHIFIARKGLWDQIINIYIWGCITLVIMGCIMQKFGLTSNYGAFQFASMISIVGLFEVYYTVAKNIMDIEGDRNISYYLTLPTRPATIFLSMTCSYTIMSIALTLLLLPLGGIVLYRTFDMTTVSWPQFSLLLLLANNFFAVFSFAMIGHVGTMSKMRNVWTRFIWPLWFLGCYQFSWQSVYDISPIWAYPLLCNPFTFITEGTRSALLGSAGFLPWGVCCLALSGYIMVGWIYGYYKIKRLLDFV
jgi:hypothetical protein